MTAKTTLLYLSALLASSAAAFASMRLLLSRRARATAPAVGSRNRFGLPVLG